MSRLELRQRRPFVAVAEELQRVHAAAGHDFAVRCSAAVAKASRDGLGE